MPIGITQLLGADEYLNHQIVNSFASVGVPDISWTEKIWLSAARRDGTLQANFGVGKYINRNVIDGFAGVSRGASQWTYRASRELSGAYDLVGAGALRCEIIEPLKKLRFVLAPNDIVPIGYDLTYYSALPAAFEGRDIVYERSRLANDVVRYYQAGTVEGHIVVDGQRVEVNKDDWFACRDRSWGVRKYVGAPAPDLQPDNSDYFRQRFMFNWMVSHLVRPDGSSYGLQVHHRELGGEIHNSTGHVDEADGSRLDSTLIVPELCYSSADRTFKGGRLNVTMRDGRTRSFELEPLSDIAFNLQPALYMPWKGMLHGTWKGELHQDGELIEDRATMFDARTQSAWQLRDRPIRIREGDATGYGILETVVNGDWPGLIVD